MPVAIAECNEAQHSTSIQEDSRALLNASLEFMALNRLNVNDGVNQSA